MDTLLPHTSLFRYRGSVAIGARPIVVYGQTEGDVDARQLAGDLRPERQATKGEPFGLLVVFAGASDRQRVDIEADRHHPGRGRVRRQRSEEHTSELQSLMRISYAVFCLKKKT